MKNLLLTDKGKEEINQVAQDIVNLKPDVIITSPMTHCRESLDIILQHIGDDILKDIEVLYLDSIKSINHGNWNGKNKEALVGKGLLSWFAKWNSYIFAKSPGGESLAELVIRVNNLLNYINKNCVGKRVLVIRHDSLSWL